MGQKNEKFREFRTPFPPRDIRKNPRSMYARVLQAMAQFVLKIEFLSHIMGTTPILEMARAYGLHPRLWLLICIKTSSFKASWFPRIICAFKLINISARHFFEYNLREKGSFSTGIPLRHGVRMAAGRTMFTLPTRS